MSTTETTRVRVSSWITRDITITASVWTGRPADPIPDETLQAWSDGWAARHGADLDQTPQDLVLSGHWTFSGAYAEPAIIAGLGGHLAPDEGPAWLEPSDDPEWHEWAWYDGDCCRWRLGLGVPTDTAQVLIAVMRAAAEADR